MIARKCYPCFSFLLSLLLVLIPSFFPAYHPPFGWHKEYLLDCARLAALTSHTSVEVALNNILKAEAASATFCKLKCHAKGEQRTTLLRVEIPILDTNSQPTGASTSITNPSELFSAITTQNILHFSQAMDTPGVSGHLGQIIPPCTRNVHSDSILQGTYDLSNIDPMPEIRQFLEAMVRPSALHSTSPIDTTITTLDFQKGFRKLSDKTSSSPSGRHITHYKILATYPDLSQILARAITMPFTHSFSLMRWRTVVQFMLEKEPGNPTISKLRVIQVLEADMNFAFRLLWGKHLVHHSLSHNALSPWNFGGRPGARVHSALPLKTISYDYLCYTRQNAIIFDNDPKACFDRIIPSLGLMATERLGMPHIWIPKVAHIQGHLIFKLIILRYWLIHFIILHFFTCNSYFLNFL